MVDKVLWGSRHGLGRWCLGALLAFLTATCLHADILAAFPENTQKAEEHITEHGSYGLPIGPWTEGSMLNRRVEGRVEQSAWYVSDYDASTLTLFAPLREELLQDGWNILFECETVDCGGFDFRYSIRVIPEPAMHVDLGDFRFLSASKGRGVRESFISLLVSRSTGAGAGYIQMIRVGPHQMAALPPPPPPVKAVDSGDLAKTLAEGALVLAGVVFDTGAADVAKGGDQELAALADFLKAQPEQTLGLVGHTDASGSLEANVAISKRRAEAVRQRLIKEFGVDPKRLSAFGAGYMSPRASNQTEEGRAKNRRVEAILTSTQALAP